MIPILWRMLAKQFLRIAVPAIGAFVFVLMTLRFDDIAYFAALGAPLKEVSLFALYQIPYILPIAIPISSLIGAYFTVRQLTDSSQIVALRSAGLSIKDILTPIWLIALFASLLNFWLLSEIATHAHRQTNEMRSSLRTLNPLLLVNNKRLMRMNGYYFVALGPSQGTLRSQQVVLAFPNKDRERIDLFLANSLTFNPPVIETEDISLITPRPNPLGGYDMLFIDHTRSSAIPVALFTPHVGGKLRKPQQDQFSIRTLLSKPIELSHLSKRQISVEVVKRIMLGITPLTFAILGTLLSIRLGRVSYQKNMVWLFAWATLTLVAFFSAKGMKNSFWIPIMLYTLPQVGIMLFSLRTLHQLEKGVERS